ncbi:hypothetical protein XELAEV_18040208mg [Xenopus laevis]|uniref:G-protein coupled receptors family 1 profile domain-containing protein n=1 Tax=Xenopus laevis TaxID=8355 RepID=A0A974H8T4_XENLA|nr:hypothetical protein XELAEV_18040208mg [Xenopus laevis]
MLLAVSLCQLTFCPPLLINHFYCDTLYILGLSCTDTFFVDIVTYLFGTTVACCSVICIIISHFYIIFTILKIKSVEGRQKGFSTCGCHLTVVFLFYGTILIMYTRPSSQYSSPKGKIFCVIYIVFIPMVNPLIYILRNNEVEKAFWEAIQNKM